MFKRIKKFFKDTPLYIFLAAFALSAAVTVYALRHNNLTMVKLRDAVYAADKSGGDVNAALNNLRLYVYGHMNTNLSGGNNAIKPPIQLKYTYERLAAEAAKEVNDSGLYTKAANYCQEKIPASVSISGRGRIDCVQDYILSHGGKRAAAIPTALYQFDFVSPSWSPDLAGWSLLLTVLLLLAAIAKLVYGRVLKRRASRLS
ncbi:MAG TPA: hypothetical protein VFW52_03350 [Candidatus Saccharimonadales bacterium]|nr:hypothetical protein [Candidatus Saccharimonadales bacterium]